MATTDDAHDTDFDTAFGEATGDTTRVSEPETTAVDDIPAVDDTGDATLLADTDTDGEPGADDAVSADDADAVETDPVAPAAVETDPVAPAAVEQPPAPAPQMDPKYLAAAMAEYQNSLKASEPAAPEAAPEPPKEYTPEDFLDNDQKAALAVFDSEWSEVKGPVTALIQAHVQSALANQERVLLSQMHQSLAPIQQVTAQSQEAMHYATIQAAHPDFREKVPEVKTWIDGLSELNKPRYEQVFQRGDTREVVMLFDEFKKANGVTSAAPAQPASSAAQVPPQKTVPKAALSATLAPPTAQRSTPVNSRDPNDFEGAFDEAVSGR